MSRTLAEKPITTRNARARLEPGVHWRALDETVHLGYRRGVRGGVWLVRWRHRAGYRQEGLGAADDVLEADGHLTLTYSQATAAARHVVEERRAAAAFEAAGPVPTVRSACERYMEAVETRQQTAGGNVLKDARSRLNTHVLGDTLGEIELTSLTVSDLRAWRDQVRKRSVAETTLRRIATDLRSALRMAETEHRGKLPERYLDELRIGFAVDTRDPPAVSERPNIVLPDADVRRLLDAAMQVDAAEEWEGDFYRLALALAATGARFSQLARATVADFQPGRKRLMVPTSGKGRGAKKQRQVAVPIGDDVLAELARITAGRKGHEPLFQRWGYKRGRRLEWVKDQRRAWRASDELAARAVVPMINTPAKIVALSERKGA